MLQVAKAALKAASKQVENRACLSYPEREQSRLFVNSCF